MKDLFRNNISTTKTYKSEAYEENKQAGSELMTFGLQSPSKSQEEMSKEEHKVRQKNNSTRLRKASGVMRPQINSTTEKDTKSEVIKKKQGEKLKKKLSTSLKTSLTPKLRRTQSQKQSKRSGKKCQRIKSNRKSFQQGKEKPREWRGHGSTHIFRRLGRRILISKHTNQMPTISRKLKIHTI